MRKQQLPWVGWAVSVLSIMACQATQAADIKSLPKPHPNYTCRAQPVTGPEAICGTVDFVVQAFPIEGIGKGITACVAAFPYNKLIMKTGPTGAAASFTLKWTLPANGNFYFASHGLALTPDEDKVHEDLFASRPVVSADQYSVTITVKAGVTDVVQFDHLPIVLYRSGGPGVGGAGKKLRCAGIDPVIVNNAD
jgi:hypothetical protein